MRALAIEAIGMPLPDSSIQSIQKVTLVTGGAAVVVDMTTGARSSTRTEPTATRAPRTR